MNPHTPSGTPALQHLVVVRPEPAGQFTAEAVGLPELRATADSREEAVAQVRKLLDDWLASGQLVAVEIPQANPLTKYFGHAKDDPDFDLYLEEIRRYRQEVDEGLAHEGDEPACSDSSSTPTT
jgi:hypothetical protein